MRYHVKIKSRNEILNDIIRDAKKHPTGWKAAFGRDEELLSYDYYIFNPRIGIYLLKEYQKNPFDIKGIGAKIARHIDKDIENMINKKTGDFGIIQSNIRKILKNIEKGIHPQKILDAAIKGKYDLGLKMPVRGYASTSKDTFSHLKDILSAKHKELDIKLEKMIYEDGIYNSYS